MTTAPARLLLVDFGVGRYEGGHRAEYTDLLRNALAPLHPVMLTPYLEANPPTGRLDRYVRFTKAMWGSFHRGDVVVFHTPEGRDFLVLVLLTMIPGLRRGRAVFMMRRGADVVTGSNDWRARLIERLVRALVRRGVARLVSDSRAASRTWEAISGRPVPVIPLPARPGLEGGRSSRRLDGPPQVSLLGLFRQEKGIDRYAAVLRAARSVEPNVRLFCQLAEQPGTALERDVINAIVSAYGDDPSAVLHAGHLSSEEYEQVLLSSDVVVLPYEPSHYTSGSSGVLFDALTAGAVVLSTRIVWAVGEFGDSTSVVWLAGRDDDALQAGIRDALRLARRRRGDGIPADLPDPEAFAAGWTGVIHEEMASPRG